MRRITLPAFMLLLAATAAFGQSVSLTIGTPAAGEDLVLKDAAFIFRVSGCTDPSTVQVSATAEGLVDGARRSVPLRFPPSVTADVYSVSRRWPREGRWMIAITASCSQGTAGAIVPMGSQGFVRDAIRIFPRAVSPDDIEVALRDHTPPQTLR